MIHDAGVELQPVEQLQERERTVLIIDDDAAQSESLAWRLQSQGFETLTASLGRRGLVLARSERPDVILLDLQLPDIDGLKVCQELTDSPATAGIPVVIISGHDRADVVRQARSAGSEFFLRKPYDPNVVLMIVEQAIARSRQW
jgi:two-component system cell cycle sensor histidine kinase/response regulator CckA